MDKCPKCCCEKLQKNGRTKSGVQRYKCCGCGRSSSVILKVYEKSKEMKNIALSMYLEGLGFRKIGRILNVSHVSVFQWIRDFGLKAKAEKQQKKHEKIVEMDELHTYSEKKKLRMDLGGGRQVGKKVH